MSSNYEVVSTGLEGALATNKVIRNTYLLLSATLLFSALTAGLSLALNMPPMGPLVTIGGYFALLFATSYTSRSAWGLLFVFALTGFLGLTLGPFIGFYLHMPHGAKLVATAMGGTGAIFLGLSAYALTTRKDFSFMGGFLFVGVMVAFMASLAALFFNLPTLSLVVSGMFILLSSGIILWQTSEIIHGGETNYIMATVTLYVSIYNLFVSLLRILGAFSSND